jgi:glutamate:GABA antiporter
MGEKKLKLFELVLFTVCGILVIDTFVAPAVIGVASITIWILTAIFFFVPYGFINAELGAAYPQDGGIFSWVKRAYGDFSATIVSWFYWFNVALWMPAVFIAFAYWFSYAFAPEMSMWSMAFLAIALSWVVAAIGVRGIDLSVNFTNLGAILKVAILLFFGFLGAIYGMKNGFQNDFSFSSFIPSLDNALLYAPAIVYNFMGFELISSVASSIDEPEKNIPKMTILAAIMIAVLYVVGTFGLLAALPAAQIDPVDGFLYTLEELVTVFGNGGPAVFKIVVGLALFTLMTNMISWTLGGTEVLSAADLDKKSPGVLGHRHKKYDTADYSYYILAGVSSLLIALNFALSEDANEIFWTILSLSFIVFLIPYLWLFPTAVKLRRDDPSTPRPYTVPGGKAGLMISAVLGELFIVASIALLFLPDDSYNLPVYYTTLIVGTAISALIGVVIYRRGRV